MGTRNLGIKLESRKKDNVEDSVKLDWGSIFMLLKTKNFTHEEILKLSYPQFNAYMNNINNSLTYPIFIPYLGGSKEEENKVDDKNRIDSKEELLQIINDMNSEFR